MKVAFLALIALIAVASTQTTTSNTASGAAPSSLPALPPCAKACVVQFTSGGNIGGCSATDIVCICSSSTFLSSIACCLAGQCDAADQESATSYARNFCGISGVTNLPTAVSCTSTSATATSATATPSPSAKPNAGPQNIAGMGVGIAGGFVAAVAML